MKALLITELDRVDSLVKDLNLPGIPAVAFDFNSFKAVSTSNSKTSLGTIYLDTVSSFCSWKTCSSNSFGMSSLSEFIKTLTLTPHAGSDRDAELSEEYVTALEGVSNDELKDLITGAAYLGFDPLVVRKHMISKEPSASALASDLSILIVTQLVRGPAVLFSKKTRIQKAYSSRLEAMVRKYEIKARVASDVTAVTLPRICASFPDVCVHVMHKTGNSLTRSVPAKSMDPFVGFNGYPVFKGPYILSVIGSMENPCRYYGVAAAVLHYMYSESKVLAKDKSAEIDISDISTYAIAALNSTVPLSSNLIKAAIEELDKARGTSWEAVFKEIHRSGIRELLTLPGTEESPSTSAGAVSKARR